MGQEKMILSHALKRSTKTFLFGCPRCLVDELKSTEHARFRRPNKKSFAYARSSAVSEVEKSAVRRKTKLTSSNSEKRSRHPSLSPSLQFPPHPPATHSNQGDHSNCTTPHN